MKAWLSRAGVPFTVRHVDTDDAAYDELMALGFRAVPVTLIAGQSVRGFDRDALENAVQRWRRQTAPPAAPSE